MIEKYHPSGCHGNLHPQHLLLHLCGAAGPIRNGVQFDPNIQVEVLPARLVLLTLLLLLGPSHHMHCLGSGARRLC